MRKFRTLSQYPMRIAGRWMFVSAIDILLAVVAILLGYPKEWALLCLVLSLVSPMVESAHSLLGKWRNERQQLFEEKQRRLKAEEALERARKSIWETRQNAEQLEYERRQREATKATSDLVYFIVNREAKTVKIGVSTNPKSRLGTLQIGSPHPLELAATSPGGYSLEGQLHEQFATHRLKGEWFRLVPEIQQWIDIANGQTGRKRRTKMLEHSQSDNACIRPA